MTRLLVALFQQTPSHQIQRVVYLTQGKLHPDFAGVEIGLAEKLAARAVAIATERPPLEVADLLRRTGDLGTVVQAIDRPAHGRPLTVDEVHSTLEEIAHTSGSGAQSRKLDLLAALLRRASPEEAKYLVRTVTGRLRLGIGDMTVLDALAEAFAGGKKARPAIERAYNITSDLGLVAKTLMEGGIPALEAMGVVVGDPIRPMLAERLSSAQEILEKMGGRTIAEYKYDGERVQVHKNGDEVILFSRRLESITDQYPDAVALIREGIKAKTAILECEIVAVDPQTNELQPFQELMHRRRKHGINAAMADYPVALFAFEALYVDGQDLTRAPYEVRHRTLRALVTPGPRMHVAQAKEVSSPEALDEFFLQAIQDGCEGLICKSIHANAIYQAGARGWQWIKYKRDYKSEMTDAVDLVVVGAFAGRGRRGGGYGAVLLAAYDPERDRFRTVTKCGSGFSDQDLAELPDRLRDAITPTQPPRVESKLVPDVWCAPQLVVEVIGAEITLSPIHTSAQDVVRPGAGLAIRFPRFTRYRDDKGPTDATTEHEILEMYQRRLMGSPRKTSVRAG
jgi:DNA ligase-1